MAFHKQNTDVGEILALKDTELKKISDIEAQDDTILCVSCSVPIMQVYEKSISGYIYKYCSRVCAEEDFTMCSNCGEAEVSKKDCADGRYDCCRKYLGCNPQYYCSGRCEGEDITNFIRSFRKST